MISNLQINILMFVIFFKKISFRLFNFQFNLYQAGPREKREICQYSIQGQTGMCQTAFPIATTNGYRAWII